MKKFFSLAEIFKSTVAIVLIALCLLAFNWQWNKGSLATSQNRIITANLTKVPLTSISQIDPIASQWQRTSLIGNFVPEKQVLIRNRYSQGKFGFEVLQLFEFAEGKIWINRGWIKAGKSASTPPSISPVSGEQTQILARIRSEDLSRQLQGSFFAVPAKNSSTITDKKIFGETNYEFYLDLLKSNIPQNAPLTPLELPDLSNGPHYAYAIQWLAFATLILIGRGLLFRETQRLPLV